MVSHPLPTQLGATAHKFSAEGELLDLIDEFSEGRVQFAYVKVTDPNTGLPKNVLIAWCGEGVPERTKGYFTSHLASVSKFLHVRPCLIPPPPHLPHTVELMTGNAR